MLKLEYLKEFLIISVALSAITCTLIQKTKRFFKSSKYIMLYSFFVNIMVGHIFSISFTNITFPNSLWIGFFSFLGADSIYKTLEGKISSYSDISRKKLIRKSKENFHKKNN